MDEEEEGIEGELFIGSSRDVPDLPVCKTYGHIQSGCISRGDGYSRSGRAASSCKVYCKKYNVVVRVER